MIRRKLFGTNGVRGLANIDLTPSFVSSLGQAIGTFFGSSKTIYLGMDGRTSGPFIKYALMSGLMSVGCRVVDTGMVPTPALQYAVTAEEADGGVMITASHNPPEYNGIKVAGKDGIEISGEDEKAIEDTYYAGSWKTVSWEQVHEASTNSGILDLYRKAIKKHVDVDSITKAGLKVVVDPGNGVGSLVTPYLLRELGCAVTTINSHIDGISPSRMPEPTPASLQDLMITVKALGADLGIAHDGDADRAVFIDDRGGFQWGDRTFGLIEKFFLKSNPGSVIVTPVSSSQMIAEIAESFHGKVEFTRVGSTVVSRRMVEIGAMLGGEENGGVFYGPHQSVRDGAMTAALLLDIIAKEGKALSELLNELPRYYSVKDKVVCPNNMKNEVTREFISAVKAERFETIDGIKIWPDKKSWILIRPSGTEPIFRIFVESTTEKKTRELLDANKKLLINIVKKLKRRLT
ncbi:MAG TPA: phosphoglucosamine mutase [Candidatus Bathyarchaeia archaeon]|nr:MAG: phosphoglucosamine mutase [Candidatus Bathyarchaeota archaeon RBG_16_48_13]HJX23708.1 phosphoglucosamine mutase [Candidatus Bathyarchaeia archaeon]